MIGNSALTLDDEIDITVNGQLLKDTKGPWEILTRKKVNRDRIITNDLKAYRHILEMINTQLENNEPSNNIKTTRRVKYKAVITKLLPATKRGSVEAALKQYWVTY